MSRRISIALAAFVVVSLAVLGAAGWGVHVLAVDQQTRVDAAATAAPVLYRRERAHGVPDPKAIREVAVALSTQDVRVFPLDPPGGGPGPGPAPFGPPGGGPPLAAVLGLHAVHVDLGATALLIVGDDRRLAGMATALLAGALAILGVAFVVLIVVRVASAEAAAVVGAAFAERRDAQQAMERFVVDAGHELRTPLSVVIGFVDVLEAGQLGPEASRRLYTAMRAEAARMHRMIESLIALARLHEPPPEPEQRETVDVCAVAVTVRDAFAATAGDRTIAVRVPVRAAWVRGSENDVYDALFPCVDNALKYGARSDVTITIESGEDTVTVTVGDRGPGMPAAVRQRAFDRFYRGARTRTVLGSGLGLAIVKRATERLGGTVALHAADGRGTRVVLTLPRAPAPAQLEEY
jgi:signal transduction histidine kinase